jgi:hypothetical protein
MYASIWYDLVRHMDPDDVRDRVYTTFHPVIWPTPEKERDHGPKEKTNIDALFEQAIIVDGRAEADYMIYLYLRGVLDMFCTTRCGEGGPLDLYLVMFRPAARVQYAYHFMDREWTLVKMTDFEEYITSRVRR